VKAVSYGELAARRAMSVYAYSEAERHLNQALKVQAVLDPEDRARRCDLLLALGEAILPSEEPQRAAERVAPEAFSLADDLHDAKRAARVAVLALEAMIRSDLGIPSSADFHEWTERADRTAAADTRERVYTDVCLFLNALFTAGPVAAHPYLRRAVDEAPASGDNATFYLAAGWGLRNLRSLPDRDRIRALASEIVDRPRKWGPIGRSRYLPSLRWRRIAQCWRPQAGGSDLAGASRAG
jgi:hypothetical protein